MAPQLWPDSSCDASALPRPKGSPTQDSKSPLDDGMLQFFQKLREDFGDRFLGFLTLNYCGLKGFAMALSDASILPYLQAMRASSTEFQLASMVAQLPWSMKGFIGVLSDCVPLGRYHKRGYLLLAAFIGGVALATLTCLPTSAVGPKLVWVVAGLFCAVNILYSTFDLLCEGKYSELMRDKGGGSEVLTLVWTCVNFGGLFGAIAIGVFIDTSGPQPLMAVCLPLAALAAWRTAAGDLPEAPARSWRALRLKASSEPGLFVLAMSMAAGSLLVAIGSIVLGERWRAILCFVVSGSLIWYSFRVLPRAMARANLYMFLVSVCYLDLTGPLAYFYTGGVGCVADGPHFDYAYYLAVSNVVGAVGAAFGAIFFQCMQSWSFRAAFCVTAFLQVLASSFDLLIVTRTNIALGLPDKAVYLFGDAACQQAASQMATMPMALLTSRLCPRGAEATVFAILAGFQNFGIAVSAIFGAQLAEALGVVATTVDGPCNFEQLPTLVLICHCAAPILCLPFTWLLVPAARIDDETAFETIPPPSFRSPPASPASSVASSPYSSPTASRECARFVGAEDRPDDYFLLQETGDDGSPSYSHFT